MRECFLFSTDLTPIRGLIATTKNICQISFVLARSLRESGQDDFDMIREYQVKSGHCVSFDWGKKNEFWMCLSLFKLLLELAVTECFFLSSCLTYLTYFCCYSPPCVSLWRFYGSNTVLYFPAILHSSVLSFIFPVCSLMFWGLGNNLVSVLSTVTNLLILLFYLFLLVFSDTFCICTP